MNYYFNPDTQRTSQQYNRSYKAGAKEIFRFTRSLKSNDVNEVQQSVYEQIKILLAAFEEQISYIQEIENIRYEKSKTLSNSQNVY